jgi:gliding motility-associated-like protein
MNFCRDWYSPGEGTPDYCNKCNSGEYSVPTNLWGSQTAKEGFAYAHIICYYPTQPQYREYIQVDLAAPLIANETYTVSFYVSCSDGSRFAVDGMGLFFSTGPIIQPGKVVIPMPGDPHINNTPGTALQDKDHWVQISGSYTAQGGEQYITIGNFLADIELTIHTFSNSSLQIASYYIDKISVEPEHSWLELGNDTTLCPGESLMLDASIPGEANYTWENGSSDPQRTVLQPGTYSVEVEFGCSPSYDQITIDYYDNPYPFLSNDTAICSGNQIILDAGDQFDSYTWQDGSEDQTYTADKEGLYWVEVLSELGCRFYDTVDIVSTLCTGHEITLDPEINGPYMNYLWSDNSTDQELTVSDSGYYWLDVSNPCGLDTDTVYLEYINCNPALFVPNAFSPNGDLKNDIFLPKGVNIGQYRMLIYDRWGSMVFESNSLEYGWNGKIKGEPCPTGVYVWVIFYESLSNSEKPFSETLKGTCLLLH